MKVTCAREDGGGSLRPRLVSYFRCAYKVSLRLYLCAINLLHWAVGEAQAVTGGLSRWSLWQWVFSEVEACRRGECKVLSWDLECILASTGRKSNTCRA